MKPRIIIILSTLLLLLSTTGYGQSAGPDQTTCMGSIITMAATGTGTWGLMPNNPGGGVYIDTPSSRTTFVTGFNNSGVYRFIWTTAAGSDTMAVTVTAATPPSISVTASLSITCSNLPDTFTVTTTNGGSIQSYQWYHHFSNPFHLSQPIGTNSPTFVTNIDTVFVLVTCNASCASQPTTYLSGGTFRVLPALSAPTLSNHGTCVGSDTIILTGTAHSSALDWYKNGTLVNTTTQISTVAGGGSASANSLNGPVSIDFDGSGALYVADWSNYRVQKFPAGSTAGTNAVTVAGGNGNGSAANQIGLPSSVFVDASGNLYVSDVHNNRVMKFPAGSTSATNGVIVAGGNGQGSAANQFNYPSGVFVDAAGNIYVCDEANSRVLKFPAGSTSATNGVVVAGGNGTGSAANQLADPSDLYVDASGNLYIADQANYRVQKFPAGSTSATNGITVAGGNGQGDAANQFYSPNAVYLDGSGYLYVSDNSQYARVQKFAPGSTSASNGVTVAGGYGNGSLLGQLNGPYDVKVDAGGNIYIADYGNYKVEKWAHVDSLYIPTTPGIYTASVLTPNGCMSDISNAVTVTSCAFSAGPDQTTCTGGLVTMAATGIGTWHSVVAPGVVSISNLSSPNAFFMLGGAGVYKFTWNTASGSDTVAITVNPGGPSLSVIPSQSRKCGHAATDTFTASFSNAGTSQSFLWNNHWYPGGNPVGSNSPTYISTMDTAGVIMTCNSTCASNPTSYFAYYGLWDTLATPATPVLSQTGACLGSDSLILNGGFDDFQFKWYNNGAEVHTVDFPVSIVGAGNGEGAGANQLDYPGGLCLDNSGNVYVADDYNDRIQKFPAGSTSATNGITVAGGNGHGNAANQLYEPYGVCIDASGNLYVADGGNYRVQKFPAGSTSASSAITVAGGNGAGSAANQITPIYIYVDAAGYLYVADAINYRIMRFPPGSTSATSGTVIAGGNGSGNAANQLAGPTSFGFDPAGALYVYDPANSRVQKFPPNSNSTTNATTVITGLSVNSCALYMSPAGDLYVADRGHNNCILKFPAGNITTSAGVIVAGGHGFGPNRNQFYLPRGICTDTTGNIYMCDFYNNWVQKWYTWQFDSVYTPQAAGTYTATVVGVDGCVSAPSNAIIVNTCLSDSVWPGDANHNGVADNNDLLPIGTAYGLNGFARTNQSIVWSAHYAADWGVQFLSGVNTKHADCNGDAVIDANDTTAILQNFGLTHTKTDGAGAPWRSGIPGITLHYSKDTVVAGDTLVVGFYLGDSTTNVSNIYGLAFTYHYDPLVSDSTTTSFGFTNSFLGNSSTKISLHKDFRTDGMVKAAVTGINHINRSGHGEIAQFSCIITTDNLNGKDLSYYANVGYISDITAIDKDEIAVTLNAGADSNEVAYEPTGIHDLAATSRISLYPNPAAENVMIRSSSAITDIAITDMQGRRVYTQKVKGMLSESISISALAAGVYTVQVSTIGGAATSKLIVSR